MRTLQESHYGSAWRSMARYNQKVMRKARELSVVSENMAFCGVKRPLTFNQEVMGSNPIALTNKIQ